MLTISKLLYQVQRYRGRISGPIMDRIDIHLEVPAVRYEDLQSNNPAESSSSIRERIVEAKRKQRERFQQEGLYANALMRPWHIRKYCQLDESEERILRQAIERPGLSARAYHDPAAKTLDVFSRASSHWILSETKEFWSARSTLAILTLLLLTCGKGDGTLTARLLARIRDETGEEDKEGAFVTRRLLRV